MVHRPNTSIKVIYWAYLEVKAVKSSIAYSVLGEELVSHSNRGE